MEHHPDKGGDPAKFREVTHAYKMLSDPGYRRAEEMSKQGPKKDLHVRLVIPIKFEDAFFGRTLYVNFNRVEVDEKMDPVLDPEKHEITSIRVKVPAGALNGHQHVEPNQGLIMKGVESGDAIIIFQVMAHQKFRVDDNGNVSSDEQIPLDLMLQGGEMEVQTMWGLQTVKIKPGTKPGGSIRIKGFGVNRRGEHVISVTPIFPEEAELRSKESWKKLDINWHDNEEVIAKNKQDEQFEKLYAKLSKSGMSPHHMEIFEQVLRGSDGADTGTG